ncbi:hypothetical protein M422DRAFT_274425 [Sphaerobolus stellatus SS14]|uniref:Uncharacterized protein n=1 Tax=Sphaerobolus stellatus (strain SS14) TaxID=990650 RepID=A0A0C9UH16_SPHS4|nr:hypothetical protein M422DRAFT_274425 [Sphaerobolus stellatus SS14]
MLSDVASGHVSWVALPVVGPLGLEGGVEVVQRSALVQSLFGALHLDAVAGGGLTPPSTDSMTTLDERIAKSCEAALTIVTNLAALTLSLITFLEEGPMKEARFRDALAQFYRKFRIWGSLWYSVGLFVAQRTSTSL